MESLETKKLALIRVLQILHQYSDCDHPLTQEEISKYLEEEYGIFIERKAIARNISLLKEAGYDIETGRGSYMATRDFEDSELQLLIDGVLQSKYITAKHSKDLIEKLSKLSNKYFRSHIKNVYSVNEWNKTENQSVFYNIEVVDTAIEEGKQIQFDYNKYDVSGNLRKSSSQRVTPYQLVLHNQKYYLMGYNDRWHNMAFYRLERITNMEIYDKPAVVLESVEGYENGIDFKQIATTMPYMYADKLERIEFIADESIIDHIFDWFGKDIKVSKHPDLDKKVIVSLIASPNAMEHWVMQYLNYVELVSPQHLRDKVCETLKKGMEKYGIES